MGKKSKRRGGGGTAKAKTKKEVAAAATPPSSSLAELIPLQTIPTIQEMRDVLDEAIEQYETFYQSQPEEPLHVDRLRSFNLYVRRMSMAISTSNIDIGLKKGANFEKELDGVHWERFLIPIKPSDKKFLKRIVSDQASSHPLYVAHAHLILGHWYNKLRDDLGKGFWHFTLSLEVCDTFLASETFETKKELPTFLKPFRFRDGRLCKPSTVREYIQCVREEAEFQVDLGRTLKEVTYGRIPGDCCFHCGKCKKDHDNIDI
jgi:hypothetical protein